MGRKLFFLLCIIALSSCVRSRQAYRPDQGYLTSLSTMNFELWGDMSLGEYADDFSTLTYEDYIGHAAEETKFKDVLAAINSAQEHCFIATKDSFIVCLKYEADGYAVCDNASTPRLDKIEKISTLRGLNDMMHALQK